MWQTQRTVLSMGRAWMLERYWTSWWEHHRNTDFDYIMNHCITIEFCLPSAFSCLELILHGRSLFGSSRWWWDLSHENHQFGAIPQECLLPCYLRKLFHWDHWVLCPCSGLNGFFLCWFFGVFFRVSKDWETQKSVSILKPLYLVIPLHFFYS